MHQTYLLCPSLLSQKALEKLSVSCGKCSTPPHPATSPIHPIHRAIALAVMKVIGLPEQKGMGALHIPLSWHVLDDSPFSCLPPRQEYRTVEPKVNLSPLSTPLGGEPGWPQSTTSDMGKTKTGCIFEAFASTRWLWDETNRYTPVAVCPTAPWADRSAQVTRTGSILGYSRRKPQCRRWSCHVRFCSGGWNWRGFLDRSSWPLHTERHTKRQIHREVDKACVIWQEPGRVISPPHLKCFNQLYKCKCVYTSEAALSFGNVD